MIVQLMGLVALLVGCGEPKETAREMILGGQSGEDGEHCTGLVQFDIDEMTPIGLSGQTLLDDAAASTSYTLSWEDGSTTALTLQVGYSTGSVTMDDDCLELVVEVDLVFATGDGAFAEQGPALLTSTGGETALSFVWDQEGLSGTYTPPPGEAEGAATVMLLGKGTFGAIPLGTLVGSADGGPEFSIATWQ